MIADTYESKEDFEDPKEFTLCLTATDEVEKTNLDWLEEKISQNKRTYLRIGKNKYYLSK